MGKRIKKGKKGEQSQYLTRSKAIRKMQLSLKDFRRICILKGIYPREPNKKFEGTNKTYYHIKDLKILMHDQLLEKFREIKAHLKKHKKYLGRKETKLAEEHIRKTPKIPLAHVIKERYPSIVDALRDLDDALCLIALFASLPQHQTLEISKKDTNKCRLLLNQFLLYCSITQAFKKIFFSIKGVYIQVEIMGQDITWITPYQFNQRLPFDVDYKVMNTFLEFYMSLTHFINFKIFHELGFSQPPQLKSDLFDPQEVRQMQKDAQIKLKGLSAEARQEFQISEEFKNSDEVKKLTKREDQIRRQKSLFKGLKFQLGRETPIWCLQHFILSFGGHFGSDDYPLDLNDKITHQVMDRPLKGSSGKNVECIQPQWIADCVNNLYLLPVAQYKPGVPPPPHLSPFLDDVQEGYIPSRRREIQSIKGEELEVDENDESSIESEPEQVKAQVAKKPAQSHQQKGDEDSSSEEVDSEEEKEKVQKVKNIKLKKDLQKEQQELGKILMSKKQRKMLYEVDKTQKLKKEGVKRLKEKRKKIEGKQK